jgi:hypothetical protein
MRVTLEGQPLEFFEAYQLLASLLQRHVVPSTRLEDPQILTLLGGTCQRL